MMTVKMQILRCLSIFSLKVQSMKSSPVVRAVVDVVVCVLLGLVLLTAGCSETPRGGAGGSSGGGGSPRKALRIAVIPKGTTHDFWKSVHAGAADAANELGDVQLIWNGPDNEEDKEGQIKIVDTFIGEKVDGICLAPIDRDAFVPSVERAKQRGVPVVIYDSGLTDMTNVVSYVATDNYQGGVIAGEHMAKVLNGNGGVILLRYKSGSESTEQRELGFLETLAKHSGIKIVSESQRVDSDAVGVLKIGEAILRDKKGEVDGVFTVCEPINKGMLQALENEQLAGKIRFIAFDSDPRVLNGLSEGKVDGVVLQDPVRMGYLAVKTMVDHIRGKPVEKRISTGEKLATRENMNEPEMQRLLKPKQAD
jgi:ribose transport system substrate-binding protein